jgi:hypothetical protein
MHSIQMWRWFHHLWVRSCHCLLALNEWRLTS